jgi:hypothetical protein
MSSYFTPKSDIHGMLLWHSTGSGKTCTAIATASTSFESAGWTILWVTRSSLKKDMQKNMVTCRNTDSTNNSSSSWIPTMSYRQFTNFLQGKNELYKRLTKRNGKDDPLRKTLLIVDEAHLVINPGDLLPVERPDKRTLQKWLHNSYEKSGQESCKVMLMTATPITESPLNLVELINMVKDKDDVLTTVPSEFQNMYLSHAHGKFTAAGKRAFQKWIGPHVSYLNRMFDARQFAQPIVKTVLVPMTTRMQMVETKHDIVEKLKNTIGYYSRKKNMMNEYLKKGRLDGKLLKEKIASNTKLIIKRDKLEKRIAIAKTDATRLKLAMQLDSIKVVDDRELREAEIKNNDVILGIKFTLKNIVGDQKVELSKIKLQGKIMDTDISQERMLRIDCGL